MERERDQDDGPPHDAHGGSVAHWFIQLVRICFGVGVA
jgi:hypothetical protein